MAEAVYFRTDNVLDSEQVTVTTSASFLYAPNKAALLQKCPDQPGQAFWHVSLTNNGANPIYINFTSNDQMQTQGDTLNVSSTNYCRELAPSGDFQTFWLGRGALQCLNVVATGGSSDLNVVISG